MAHNRIICNGLPHALGDRLALPGIDIEVQTYRQPERLEALLEVPRHTLSMSLTPQVRYSRACYVGADGREGTWADVGDVTFAPEGARLLLDAPGGAESYRGIYCMFSVPVFQKATGMSDQWSARQLEATLNVKAPAIKRDMYRILEEVSERSFGREHLVHAMTQAVLVELARYLRAASQPAPPCGTVLAGWQMRRITDYVEGMVDRCPGVEELSGLCGISPRHLSRAFKASTGRTVGEYVTEVRMVKARSLLTRTGLSQKEIAHRLGFAGPSSFCTAFRQAVGVTPGQYRESNDRHGLS